MTDVSLRDPSWHGERPVRMVDDDRILLAAAADAQRAKLLRRQWFETWWGRTALVAGAVSSVATIVGNVIIVVKR